MHVRTSEQMTTHLFIYPLFFDNTFFMSCVWWTFCLLLQRLFYGKGKKLKRYPFSLFNKCIVKTKFFVDKFLRNHFILENKQTNKQKYCDYQTWIDALILEGWVQNSD